MADGRHIRVGLAGFGLAGRVFHAPFIAATPGLRLTHVLQRRGHEAAELYPGVEVVPAFDALLSPDAQVDLVVIATPDATHAPLATLALDAGKHVVVDKPFTTSSDEARRLTDLARRRGCVLSVFQNRRWDGDFLTVVEILRRGWLGALERYESRFDRYRPSVRPGHWRDQAGPGTGLTFEFGPHLLDQALVLFGRPLALTARIETERPDAVTDDHFDITLHYQGFEARVGAGMLAEAPGPRFRISGALGRFEKHGFDPQEFRLRAGARPDEAGWGEDARDAWGRLETTFDGLGFEGRLRTLPGDYGRFYRNICEAIHGREPVAVTAEQATETIRAIELAFESSRRGGERLRY